MSENNYKVGDHVRIKSFDWYNENKDEDGVVHCGDRIFDDYMSVFCGSVVTICGIYPHLGYDVREDMQCRTWTDDMIECLADVEPQEKMISLDKACEWIEKNFRSDGYFSLYYVGGGIYTPKNIAKDFRKAMEE